MFFSQVYIPELGMTFKVQRGQTRLFACQNPLNQGGGRKGLPKSFLNRFTQVELWRPSWTRLFIYEVQYSLFCCGRHFRADSEGKTDMFEEKSVQNLPYCFSKLAWLAIVDIA